MTDFPTPDMALTHILVVSDLERSRRWYADVLGATLYREYGGSSAVLQFNEAWLLIVTGGGPTPDKPSVTLAAPADPDRPDHLFTIRVDDCRATYDLLVDRGAEFLYVTGDERRRDARLLARPRRPPLRDQRVPILTARSSGIPARIEPMTSIPSNSLGPGRET